MDQKNKAKATTMPAPARAVKITGDRNDTHTSLASVHAMAFMTYAAFRGRSSALSTRTRL